MKIQWLPISVSICFLLMIAAAPQGVQAQDTPKSAVSNIYDESSDGAKQISDALVIAKKEHKRILLEFGANWCIWCRRLHTLFETNQAIAKEIKSGYVVVMIDVNKDHNKATDAKYGQPTLLGLPVIVILDAYGKQLTTQDSGKLEEGDHHSPERVLAFLTEWTQKR